MGVIGEYLVCGAWVPSFQTPVDFYCTSPVERRRSQLGKNDYSACPGTERYVSHETGSKKGLLMVLGSGKY